MTGGASPTRSSCKPPIATHLDEANLLIQALWDRLNDLEERLNQNSRNSSRPPSSNGPGVHASTPRKSSGRQRGAQTGHKGSKRVLVDDVNETRSYFPEHQCACGGAVTMSKTPYRRHQVFDIPEQAYSVTEHQLYQGQCNRCGNAVKATLPDSVNSGQIGNNLLAYVAVQAGQFHQSISKIQQQLRQNFGLHFSRGAISQAQGTVSSMLTPAYQDIKTQTLKQAIVHCDETRHQRGNENRWMWQVCTSDLSFFMTHFSRGTAAAKKLLGEAPSNIVVTDQ